MNLLLAVVIIAVASGAYYLYSLPTESMEPTDSFAADYDELKEIWSDGGLDVESMKLDNLDFMDLMAGQQASSLHASLLEYKVGLPQDAPISELAEIYTEAASLFIENKQFDVELDELTFATDELCSNELKLQEANTKTVAYLNAAIGLKGKIEEFKTNYPEESNQIGLSGSALNVSDLSEAKESSNQFIETLEAYCAVN